MCKIVGGKGPIRRDQFISVGINCLTEELFYLHHSCLVCPSEKYFLELLKKTTSQMGRKITFTFNNVIICKFYKTAVWYNTNDWHSVHKKEWAEKTCPWIIKRKKADLENEGLMGESIPMEHFCKGVAARHAKWQFPLQERKNERVLKKQRETEDKDLLSPRYIWILQCGNRGKKARGEIYLNYSPPRWRRFCWSFSLFAFIPEVSPFCCLGLFEKKSLKRLRDVWYTFGIFLSYLDWI